MTMPIISFVAVVISLSISEVKADSCSNFPTFSKNATSGFLQVTSSIQLWQAVLLIIGFGVFTLLLSIFFRLVRRKVYRDDSVSDTFFDAGGDVNFALVTCAVIIRWLWTSSFTWSTFDVYQSGIVGNFWYSAAASVPILLFATVACELRVKAPGAKTFLQVIRQRFGPAPHILLIIVAVVVNILVAGIVKMEGIRIITALTQNVSYTAVGALLAVVVGIITLVGGIGGGLYSSYFTLLFVIGIALAFFIDTFFNPLGRSSSLFKSGNLIQTLYNISKCASAPASTGNQAASILTFSSYSGLLEGVLIVLSGLGSVFVNQAFYQSAVIAKPVQVVTGHISAAIVYFGIPLLLSYTFGMSYWAVSVQRGSAVVSKNMAALGYLPVIMSHLLLEDTGDFLMCSLTIAVVVGLLSSQVVALTSVFLYDIYETYFDPFSPPKVDKTSDRLTASHKTSTDKAVLKPRKKRVRFVTYAGTVFMTHVVFTSAMILLELNVSLSWMFKLIGIIAGSSAIPVSMSITWHRTTGIGVFTGVLTGLSVGLAGWLVYASTFSGGLTAENTNHPMPFIVGVTLSIGIGGLCCLLFSLACGGCADTLQEDDVWSKTAQIDSVEAPWITKYARYIIQAGAGVNHRSYYNQLRQSFRCSTISSIIIAMALSVVIIIVWPALMLTNGVFNESTFVNWTAMVFAWGIISITFVGLLPPVTEILQLCRYNCTSEQHPGNTQLSVAPPLRTLQSIEYNEPPIPVLLDIQTPSHYHQLGEMKSASAYVRPRSAAAPGTSAVENGGYKATIHID